MKKLLILTAIFLISMVGCKENHASDAPIPNSGERLLAVGYEDSVSLDNKTQVKTFEYTENGKNPEYSSFPKGLTYIYEYSNNTLVYSSKLSEKREFGHPYHPTTHKGEWYEINVHADHVEVTIDENSAAESRGIKFDMSTFPFLCTVTLTQSGAQ